MLMEVHTPSRDTGIVTRDLRRGWVPSMPKAEFESLLRENYGENVDGQRIEDGIRGI